MVMQEHDHVETFRSPDVLASPVHANRKHANEKESLRNAGNSTDLRPGDGRPLVKRFTAAVPTATDHTARRGAADSVAA
jgi:hypothetical protein